MTDAGVRCTRSFLPVACLEAARGLFGTAVPAETDNDSASEDRLTKPDCEPAIDRGENR